MRTNVTKQQRAIETAANTNTEAVAVAAVVEATDADGVSAGEGDVEKTVGFTTKMNTTTFSLDLQVAADTANRYYYVERFFFIHYYFFSTIFSHLFALNNFWKKLFLRQAKENFQLNCVIIK